MWTDYYLKFEDEAEFLAAMRDFYKAEASENHATDVVGTLFRFDTHEALEGFHVNLRLRAGTSLPSAVAGFVIATPAHPKRVFA